MYIQHTCIFVLLFLLLGCSTSDKKTETTQADQLWQQLSDGWNEIKPGGETICSQGTPYSFFFHPGNREKLLVFFQGGGACWNPVNCNLAADPTYDPMVDSTDNPGNAKLRWYGYDGIFDLENAANPFRDYSILWIPYCTGDTHLGDQDYTYSSNDTSFVIRHRGFTNSMASLNWVMERILNPEMVFVTGVSAGSVASPVYTAILADHYPDARITHMGDCSGAYRGEEVRTTLDRWGVATALEAAQVEDPDSAGDFNEVITLIARQYPDVTFSQYNSAFDEVQSYFLALLGESPDSMHSYLQGNMARLEADLPNYRYYVDTGKHHVILARPEFYTTGIGDIPFRDWVDQLAQEGVVESVNCKPCQ